MNLCYKLSQYPAQVVFASFFGVRTYGRENVPATGPVLLASNHQSYIDPVLCGVGLQRELDYMARASLFRNRLFGKYITALNAFAVNRDQADVKAIKEIINRLKNNRAVVLFPEATRTVDGRIRPIKSGIELIARRSQATVVPVVIDGAFECWPRQRAFPLPGRIAVAYGKAITDQQIKGMKRGELVELINTTLRQMQADLRKKMGRKPIKYN